MPDKTAADAPKTLPQQAKEIWASAFNSAWSGTCAKSGKRRDECAARVAFGAVKKTFRQDGQGKWVPKAALVDISLVITKASIQDDGTLRWQATVSDTAPDRTGEQTSIALFQDWIDRIQTGKSVSFLPPPRRLRPGAGGSVALSPTASEPALAGTEAGRRGVNSFVFQNEPTSVPLLACAFLCAFIILIIITVKSFPNTTVHPFSVAFRC